VRHNTLIKVLLTCGLGGIAAGALGGCLVRTGVGVGGTVAVAGPDLVYVAPGVYVVSDYDDSVFYSDGYYWRYDGGYWYQSGYYNRGWARAGNVPMGVRGIDRPRAYVHYRARGPVYHRGDIDHRRGAPPPRTERRAPAPPPGRDHRSPPPARTERRAPAPPPAGRDHRTPPPRTERRAPAPPPGRDHRDDDRKKGRDHR
jgi:hypothetical protein